MIIIFLLAHFLLRAIPQVVFVSCKKIEADNHWLAGFQCSAPTLQLGLWPLFGFCLSKNNKDCVLWFFSWSLFFYLHIFFYEQFHRWWMFCFLAGKELKQIIIGSPGFQRSAQTLQLGLWPLLGFFCQGTIKIAFSYFSHDFYISTYTFSFTRSSTGGECFVS